MLRPLATDLLGPILRGIDGSTNRPPVIGGSLGLYDDGQNHVITAAQLLALVTDADGDTLSIVSLTVAGVVNGDGVAVDPSRATLLDAGGGEWYFMLADNWRGVVTLALTVTDGEAEVSGTVTAQVEHVVFRNDGDNPNWTYVHFIQSAVDDGRLALSLPTSGGYVWQNVAVEPKGKYRWSLDLDAGSLPAPREYVIGVRSLSTLNWVYLTQSSNFGLLSLEFVVPAGCEGVRFEMYLYADPGVAYVDNFRLVRLNAAPVVSGALDLGSIADGKPVTWTEAELLATATDPDLDAVLSISGVTASSGAIADNGDGTWTYTPLPDSPADVTMTAAITDGTATVNASGTVAVTSYHALAEPLWLAGTEWTLDTSNPYHPQNGETGASLGFWTLEDLGGKLLRYWVPFALSHLTLSGNEVAAYRDHVAGVEVSQSADPPGWRPEYVTGAGGLNGRPALKYIYGRLFKNGDTGLPTGTAARGCYTLVKPDYTGPTHTWVSQDAPGSYTFRLQSRWVAGEPYFGGWGSDLAESSPAACTTAIKSMAAIYAGGDPGLVRMFRNGTMVVSGERTVNTVTDILDFGMTGTIEEASGRQGHVVWTDGSETADEINRIHALIHWAYGEQASLPESNPYKSVRPKVEALP